MSYVKWITACILLSTQTAENDVLDVIALFSSINCLSIDDVQAKRLDDITYAISYDGQRHCILSHRSRATGKSAKDRQGENRIRQSHVRPSAQILKYCARLGGLYIYYVSDANDINGNRKCEKQNRWGIPQPICCII